MIRMDTRQKKIYEESKFVFPNALNTVLVLCEELAEWVNWSFVIFSFEMDGMTACPERSFLFAWVLLLEDAEVGFDPVIGDGLSTKQLVKVLPLSLQTLVYAFSGSNYPYKTVDDVENGFHLYLDLLLSSINNL